MDSTDTKAMAIALIERIINDYGEDNFIEVFDLCSDYGLSYMDSPIDKIEVYGDMVRFYWNENEDDYDWVQDNDATELLNFADSLLKAIYARDWQMNGVGTTQRGLINLLVEDKLSAIFTDFTYVDLVADKIIEDVIDDINETADWSDLNDDEVNRDDVSLALQRALLKNMKIFV